MGVYFDNMKMPKNCWRCHGMGHTCDYAVFDGLKKRPADCPAIYIDDDLLRKVLKELDKHNV